MLHQLLNLTRPLFVLDCETTGVDPQRDRVVELGFQQWGPEGMAKEWRSLVDPGVPIPPAAARLHGIDAARLARCNLCGIDAAHHDGSGVGDHPFKPVPRFADLAASLAKGLVDCDYAGKSVRFDLQILTAEMARAGQPWSYAGARVVDVDRLEQLAEPRDLGSMHQKYAGRRHDGAHGALADARAATTVIAGQLETYPNLPRDLEALHAAQWPGFIDYEGKFRFIDGIACFSRWGKYANQPMSKADMGYWDFILKNDFSVEVKALASNAKLGKFPLL